MPDAQSQVSPTALDASFGAIDIYLFDQLLRGRIRQGMRILDAGCGSGRNLVYLLRAGFDLWAVDRDGEAIEAVRSLARRLAPGVLPGRFQVASVAQLPFPPAAFDVVLTNAVLHFAPDEPAFWSMLDDLWRVLAPGGLLWARLASLDGIRDEVVGIGGRRYRLPTGEERFLVDVAFLAAATAKLGGVAIDPLKTVVVHGQGSMATWCARKPA